MVTGRSRGHCGQLPADVDYGVGGANQTEHRLRLQPLLNNRSDGSIEFKHGNISAVMLDLGFPYIRGYKPRMNYQALLSMVVDQQVRGQAALDKVALAAAEQ